MTSMFESEVYQNENRVPWTRIDLIRFMKDMALNGTDGEVTLNLKSRPDVSSRHWWTISWIGPDEERYEQSSQYLDKCLWRAATAQMKLEEKHKNCGEDSPQR